MKRELLTLLLILSCVLTLKAQHKVSGIITEAGTDFPLIGATVQEKDKTIGTTTDLDGKYELEVSDAKATLVISYIGFTTQEVAIDGKSSIDAVMDVDVAGLNEVVVIGYGTQKKKVVTGAIAKVKAEALKDMPVVRLEDALSGRTAGVRVTANSGQPGDAGTVHIRGTTSINNSEPLYVVDGVIIGGGIEFLNQSDIESIEVLKDASAGIYGTRASAGVILVTTKKGTKNDRMQVNYNSYYGTQNPWRKLSLLNAREYGVLINEASAAAREGIVFDDPESLGEGTDWQDAVFNKNAPIQNHDLNISGGNERSQFYTSFNYFDQTGIVSDAQSRFQRFTTRFNSTHNINDRIRFGNNLAYTRINGVGVATNSEFGSPLSRAINIDPTTPLLETDPDVLNSSVFTNQPVVTNEDGIPYGISTLVTSEVVNPVAALQTLQQNGWSDKVVGNVYGEIEVLKGLTLRSSVGVDLAFWGNEGFTPIFYLNSSNSNPITRFSLGQNKGLSWIWQNTMTYSKKLNDHSFTALLGTSAEQNEGRVSFSGFQGVAAESLEETTLAVSVPLTSQSFGGYEYAGRLASYYGRVNYNFAEKYLFMAQLRSDGSYKFGPNNKFGLFPSILAGWVITEEDFLRNNPIVNYFKIRASWGILGNDNSLDPYRYTSTVQPGSNYTLGLDEDFTVGYSPTAIPNPDLQWEKTAQTNIGFDAKVFKKYSVTFDWFYKNTYDMLLEPPVPGYVGLGGLYGNVADMYNTGVELELGYANNFNKLRLDIRGNVSYIKNEVTFLGLDREALFGGQTFGPQELLLTRTSLGQPVNYIYGFQTDGIFQNEAEIASYAAADGTPIQPEAQPGDIRFVDFNGNGEIDPDDRTIIGDPTPQWTYGFNFVADWKGFDLVMFGQGVAGNDVLQALRRFDLPKANMTSNYLNRWTGEGSTNEFPRLTLTDTNGNFSRVSDFFVEKGGFFRLKTLQLGYTLPRQVMDKIGFQKIRLYVSGNNLFTLTPYSGFDPEIGGGSYGVDRGIYPQPRFYLVGINATF